MTRWGLLQSFVLSTSILLGLCVPPSHPSPGHAYTTTSGFTALTVYELSNDGNSNDTRLALFMFSSKKCETGIQPASCVISEDDQTVTLTVVPIDLKQGETRRYRCDAGFYETSLRTYTFYANLTLPSETTTPVTATHTTSAGTSDYTTHRDATSTNDDNFPETTTQIGALQLVEKGLGTKDNPIKVSKGADVTFYLKGDPVPVLTSAAFLGKTLLHHNSSKMQQSLDRFPENMVRCWPLRFRDLVQCEVDADNVKEGFYAATLENEVDDITVFLQVDPKKSKEATVSVTAYVAGGGGVTVVLVVIIVVGVVKRRRYLAWRARYAQIQRNHEQEMAVYRGLGEALVRDDDANVEAEERFYHVVDHSHLESDIGSRSSVNFRPRRTCRAPPYPHQVPLPLPPSGGSRADKSRRRPRSLPDDYLHPAAFLSDNSTASRSHRRRSLPSDYLHPAAILPTQ
ncbi:hypothetical protein BaRGS_00016588 [Batillaria attramentaria]|uniref:Uncharacterized protein n=1 Tax=Batillaria attramentaria TaxID=370345 RepID=A0ABD0KZ86_9CAEN